MKVYQFKRGKGLGHREAQKIKGQRYPEKIKRLHGVEALKKLSRKMRQDVVEKEVGLMKHPFSLHRDQYIRGGATNYCANSEFIFPNKDTV